MGMALAGPRENVRPAGKTGVAPVAMTVRVQMGPVEEVPDGMTAQVVGVDRAVTARAAVRAGKGIAAATDVVAVGINARIAGRRRRRSRDSR